MRPQRDFNQNGKRSLQDLILRTLLICSILITATLAFSDSVKAATITVPAGGNLQSAINAAQPGDVIILQAGASYVGSFVLPQKSGDSYITIQSSALDQLPGASQRVTPAHAALMPKILSHGFNEPALRTSAFAHHYQFIGIEFAPVNTTVIVSDLIKLGDGTSAQNSLAMIPHHLVIDRCYIHGFQSKELKRGIALNSAETWIINSHISDVHGYGYDTQAICGWNGPGPYHIINNYLEAAGENVMFGGADPYIFGLIPSDIEIRRNHFFKPLNWKVDDPSYAGYRWTVKNLFETKNARRLVVDGNIFENCWADAQVGFAILLKSNNQDNTAPWSVTEDLTFSNNIIRNVEHGLNILGIEVPPKISGVANRIRITNNLWDVRKIWYQGSNGVQGLVFDHNTFFSREGNTANVYGIVTQGFVFTNNLGVRAGYGFKGDSTGEGTSALNAFCPGWVFRRNLLVAAPPSQYPTDNYYPATLNDVGFVSLAGGNYRLSSSSPYRNLGTDGKDVGVDFDMLEAALGGSSTVPPPAPTPTPSPTPNPTPTPTPSPTPTPGPTPLPTPLFRQGDAVAVDINGVFVRSCGSTTCSVLGTQNTGINGLVMASPNWDTAGRKYFYSLDFASGQDGWVPEEHLIRVSTPNPTPTPTPTPTETGPGVRKAKKRGQNLSNQMAADSGGTSAAETDTGEIASLDLFITEIQEAQMLFSAERQIFPAAARIDAELCSALDSAILARISFNNGDVTGTKNNLRESLTHLEVSDALITYGNISNAIDAPSYMVRQHYLDFLDREPDQAGGDFWAGQITGCGTNTQCIQVRRIHVSAAFFLSIEFQRTGYFVYRLYKSSFGRMPMRAEFLPDTRSVAHGVMVGMTGWEATLEANKQAFLDQWVQRSAFVARYSSLTNRQYVDALIANLGVTVSQAERDALLLDLRNGASRANILGRIAQNDAFSRAQFNSAFVLMEYIGYLGRDPDAAGFNFWLNKLNQFNGDYGRAEMVRAFLSSIEYRNRFRL